MAMQQVTLELTIATATEDMPGFVNLYYSAPNERTECNTGDTDKSKQRHWERSSSVTFPNIAYASSYNINCHR
jgi:hypothetical protein